MAHRRYANAVLVKPHASEAAWQKVRTAAARLAGQPSANLVQQATEILGTKFDPSKYLLSHCTIVASVDTEEVPNVKLGSVKEGGKRINRKYSDYRITAATDHYINNNMDSFERRVLLMSYRTLIGAQSFVEHVQVEDLSKGRIIDAVPRDIGDSVYIDILVANDRKHKELIRDIESGRMATLSMGCSTGTTTCTKCGNVAVDETDLCECVRYAKGNIFLDERGGRHRVAELCGHHTMDDPVGGVQFIEASWVGSPAFTGAALRNIIAPSQVSVRVQRQAQEILAAPPAQWVSEPAGTRKAANNRTADFDFGEAADPGAGGDPAKPEAPKEPSPLEDLENRVLQDVLDRVEKRVREEMDGKRPPPEESSVARNDNMQTTAARLAYVKAVKVLTRTASSDVDMLDRVARLDREFGLKVSVEVYRAALKVGPIAKYGSVDAFARACRDVLGNDPRHESAILRLGRILSLAESNLRPNDTLSRSKR